MIEQKNCIPEIIKALNLKPYEQFTVVKDKESTNDFIFKTTKTLYRFSETNLEYYDERQCRWFEVINNYYLTDIILGNVRIKH